MAFYVKQKVNHADETRVAQTIAMATGPQMWCDMLRLVRTRSGEKRAEMKTDRFSASSTSLEPHGLSNRPATQQNVIYSSKIPEILFFISFHFFLCFAVQCGLWMNEYRIQSVLYIFICAKNICPNQTQKQNKKAIWSPAKIRFCSCVAGNRHGSGWSNNNPLPRTATRPHKSILNANECIFFCVLFAKQ